MLLIAAAARRVGTAVVDEAVGEVEHGAVEGEADVGGGLVGEGVEGFALTPGGCGRGPRGRRGRRL